MTEFWEANFNEKQEMWGDQPSISAKIVSDLYSENGIKQVLIPGIGYGRNAQPLLDKGITVQGIEISPTAIQIAKKKLGDKVEIKEGSVLEIDFGTDQFDGIYAHALLHLFDQSERMKLLHKSYDALQIGGYLCFTVVTTQAPGYGKGIEISNNRFETHPGVQIYYYNKSAVLEEFQRFGLVDIQEINENHPMYLIILQKEIPRV